MNVSVVVEGERTPPADLDQYPNVPDEAPVTLPLQVKSPVASLRVQPVSLEPPARAIVPAALPDGPILIVVALAVNRFPVVFVVEMVPPFTAKLEANVSAPAAVTTQLAPFI